MVFLMPRAATTSDVFNAVAEARRRDILNLLALNEWPVGDIVETLGLEQPSVSKHLRVLRPPDALSDEWERNSAAT
jgi:DNA-binding transcriptional ArsR family regulator